MTFLLIYKNYKEKNSLNFQKWRVNPQSPYPYLGIINEDPTMCFLHPSIVLMGPESGWDWDQFPEMVHYDVW